jgi:hypothetical protein
MKQAIVLALAALAGVSFAQTGKFRPYSVSADFREVANAKAFMAKVGLSPEHRSLLQRNLFVVSPSDEQQLYWVYGRNDYENLPSLITTDTVLHLYHVFFDSTLRRMEEDMLLPKLRSLSQKMVRATQKQMNSVSEPAMKEAARKNLAYFAVAQVLTEGEGFPAGDSA